MTARLDSALEARRILERQGRLAGDLLDSQVSASWQRCLAAGMDPRQIPQVPVLDAPELRFQGDACALAARLARVEMESLYYQIAGSNFMIAFGNRDGVVIDTIADPAFAASHAGRQIRSGSVWSEHVAGTNAMGTASATGQGLIVHGAEHFFACFDGITCAAAPIHHYDGSLAGVLDASSFCDAYPAHTLVLVRMAALNVANGLFRREMQQHFILELHSRSEFLGSIAAGLLAVDREGVIRGVNTQTPALMPGVRLSSGQVFDEVFQEDFASVLDRLQGGDRTWVRDLLDRTYTLALRSHGAPPQRLTGGAALAVPPASGRWPVQTATPSRESARPGGALREGRAAAHGASGATPGMPGLVCHDARLQECLRLVEAAVQLSTPMLITGETGTGKEMLARYAHHTSGRSGELVAVNCAAMPAELFEAELFGYAAGAFTGARREGHGGLIMAADGGTLLLDEIADLPMPLRAALLRFLDDFQVRPVGGRSMRVVDTLVIAATNADLQQAVHERRFRADLLYRLNTVQVALPPLRERSDLGELALAMLARIDPHAHLAESALHSLASHAWPGNVRELRAVLTRARLLAGEGRIEARHLGLAGAPVPAPASTQPRLQVRARRPLRALSADLVHRTWTELGRNVSATAVQLQISRNTVYRYLREAGHA